jgi:hypothetical protein
MAIHGRTQGQRTADARLANKRGCKGAGHVRGSAATWHTARSGRRRPRPSARRRPRRAVRVSAMRPCAARPYARTRLSVHHHVRHSLSEARLSSWVGGQGARGHHSRVRQRGGVSGVRAQPGGWGGAARVWMVICAYMISYEQLRLDDQTRGQANIACRVGVEEIISGSTSIHAGLQACGVAAGRGGAGAAQARRGGGMLRPHLTSLQNTKSCTDTRLDRILVHCRRRYALICARTTEEWAYWVRPGTATAAQRTARSKLRRASQSARLPLLAATGPHIQSSTGASQPQRLHLAEVAVREEQPQALLQHLCHGRARVAADRLDALGDGTAHTAAVLRRRG